MIDTPVRITDIHVRDKLREIIDVVNGNQTAIAANTAGLASIVPPLTLAQIQKAIQLGGSNPINITGLPGILQNPQAAAIIGTHAQRLTSTPALGTFFIETDRTVLYAAELVSGAVKWVYVAGLMATTFGSQPVDLGVNDAGFQLWITVQNHVFRWAGSAWAFLDSSGGYIADFVAPPQSTGWQRCDGTATDYLALSGSTIVATAFTTADETTVNPGTYHKSAAAYTGAINAPTAPGISGATAVATATNNANTTGVTVNAHTVTQITDVAGANNYAFTGGTDNQHTVVDPGHNHTQNAHQHTSGTIAADATGQPKNLGVLRFFRR